MSEWLTEERALAAEAPGFRVEELPNDELVIASATGVSESVRIIGYDREQGTASGVAERNEGTKRRTSPLRRIGLKQLAFSDR
jgi:hypothetical protein